MDSIFQTSHTINTGGCIYCVVPLTNTNFNINEVTLCTLKTTIYRDHVK